MKFPKRISDETLKRLMYDFYAITEGTTADERKMQWFRWAQDSARQIAAEITRRNCSDD
jgi:hypothetical protein